MPRKPSGPCKAPSRPALCAHHVTPDFWQRVEAGETIGGRPAAFWAALRTLRTAGALYKVMTASLGCSPASLGRYFHHLGMGRPQTGYNKPLRDRFLKLRLANTPVEKILATLSITKSQYKGYEGRLRRKGLLPPATKTATPMCRQIKQMHDAGHSRDYIQRSLGVTPKQVSSALHCLGGAKRRQKVFPPVNVNRPDCFI